MRYNFVKLVSKCFRSYFTVQLLCYNFNSFRNVSYAKLKWNPKTKKVAGETLFPSLLIALTFGAEKESNVKHKRHEALIKSADELYEEEKHQEVYEILYPEKHAMDDEILWRLGRALYKLSKHIEDQKQKLAALEEAFGYVEKALDINEENGPAHRWYAILLDYVWRHKSTKGRILNSFKMREHMERAVAIDQKDATSYYLLGEWCYSLAEMPWYQRNAASLIFATPPTSTFEEALQFFEKAEEVDPNFYSMNLLMIAKSYLKINNQEKAIEFLKRVLTYSLKSVEDKEAHEEATFLLKKLGVQ